MVLESDPSGTIVGSSYAWATPRDWAKYGLLYLQNGKVADQQIFPDWWAEYHRFTPAEGSEDKYGAQFWKQNDDGISKAYPKTCILQAGSKVSAYLLFLLKT